MQKTIGCCYLFVDKASENRFPNLNLSQISRKNGTRSTGIGKSHDVKPLLLRLRNVGRVGVAVEVECPKKDPLGNCFCLTDWKRLRGRPTTRWISCKSRFVWSVLEIQSIDVADIA